jgi:uncharacterized membrane protein YdbT with pleckstrin-like domain
MWAITNAAILLSLLVLFAAGLAPGLPALLRTIWLVLGAGVMGVFVMSIPITYLIQRLNYQLRWYIVTDRSLRIRCGVVAVQEITMTFANIQGIRVTANPIEGWLKLANVEVQSAGGGGSQAHATPSSGHVAKFAGLDNAELIRDLLVERLRVYRDSGLGDKPAEAPEPPALAAARDVLQASKALRNSLLQKLSPTQK